ncbi:hypothetical protein LINPERPRIM_LOCUS24594 [Linum perenne]
MNAASPYKLFTYRHLQSFGPIYDCFKYICTILEHGKEFQEPLNKKMEVLYMLFPDFLCILFEYYVDKSWKSKLFESLTYNCKI